MAMTLGRRGCCTGVGAACWQLGALQHSDSSGASSSPFFPPLSTGAASTTSTLTSTGNWQLNSCSLPLPPESAAVGVDLSVDDKGKVRVSLTM
jgi:hypothetical protein